MILCISMDLDPLWCYQKIYGLKDQESVDKPNIPDPVCPVATRRFVELAGSLGVKGTLFVVGKSLQDKKAKDEIARAAKAGHEIGNHSFSHLYDLSLRDISEIIKEIENGADAIGRCVSIRPVGFRAPGYMLGQDILSALQESGAIYDSSVMPSLAYQGLKAAAMGLLAIRGKKSGTTLADPREACGPKMPYHPDLQKPWRKGDSNILELPITSMLSIPLTGSVLAMAGPNLTGLLAAGASRNEFVNLELHGVDLMDIEADNLDPALCVQRDLSIPWQRKALAIYNFVDSLRKTHEIMTLQQAAKDFGSR